MTDRSIGMGNAECGWKAGAGARARAASLLDTLRCLHRAVDDGGCVSIFHLLALEEDVLHLLDELGGFEELTGDRT